MLNWTTFTQGLKLLGLMVLGDMLSTLLWEMYPVSHTMTWVFVLAGLSLLLIIDTDEEPPRGGLAGLRL